MATVLVTVICGKRRTDLSIPAHAAVSDVIPDAVQLCMGSAAHALWARWAIGPVGDEVFPPEATLGDLGVIDGTVLELRDTAATIRLETGRVRPATNHPTSGFERRGGRIISATVTTDDNNIG